MDLHLTIKYTCTHKCSINWTWIPAISSQWHPSSFSFSIERSKMMWHLSDRLRPLTPSNLYHSHCSRLIFSLQSLCWFRRAFVLLLLRMHCVWYECLTNKRFTQWMNSHSSSHIWWIFTFPHSHLANIHFSIRSTDSTQIVENYAIGEWDISVSQRNVFGVAVEKCMAKCKVCSINRTVNYAHDKMFM